VPSVGKAIAHASPLDSTRTEHVARLATSLEAAIRNADLVLALALVEELRVVAGVAVVAAAPGLKLVN
jgi:hypothetical protein